MRPVGYVYVLINPSMPGLVKVGMTERHNLQSRIAELSTHSGVPEDFRPAYRAQVYCAYDVEQRAHALLSKNCLKMKEFFQCDVIAAIDAVLIAAGDDLLAEESHIAQSIEGRDTDRLKSGAIRLAMLQPRGKSVTGVTRLSFDKMYQGDKAKIAWGLHSPTYGHLFYGSVIKNSEQLLKAARVDFPEVDDFCTPVLLETDAGKQVRERQALQEECDRENAEALAEENRRRLEEKQKLEANRKAVEIAKAVAEWRRAVETVGLEAERLEAARISTLKAEQKLAKIERLESKQKLFEMTRPEAKRQALQMAIAARRRATGNLGPEFEQKGDLDAEREVALEALRQAVEVARLVVAQNAAEMARQKVAWTAAQEVERSAAEIARLALDGNAAAIPELEVASKAAEVIGREAQHNSAGIAKLRAAEISGQKAEAAQQQHAWQPAEIARLQEAWKAAEIARPDAARKASEMAKLRKERRSAAIAELQDAWEAAREAPWKSAYIANLQDDQNMIVEMIMPEADRKTVEIESAAFASRMKALHGISAKDKCSVNSCGKPAELRFDGRPYCLGHFLDAKAAAETGNTEEGRCSH